MIKHHPTGFTLVEITVTISILALLACMSLLSFNDMKRNISLKNDANELANTLSYAQNKAINSFEGKKHGVFFENDKYILFSGDDFASSTNKKEYPYRNGVKLYSPVNTEIIFDRLTGGTSSRTIVIGTSPDDQETIEISSIGKINFN